MGADAARREVEDLAERLLELGLVDLAGAVQVDIDRQRLGDADGVAQLDRGAVGEAGGDDVLGEIARGIGGRAVDLGRVLAGEGAAAMRGRAAIGVDDDLAAGEAGVAIGTADDELAGRVDVPDLQSSAIGSVAERLADIAARRSCGRRPRSGSASRCWVETHDLGRFGRLAVLVAHRHLALGVGAELAGLRRCGGPRRAARRSGGRSRSAPASGPGSRGRHSRT